MSVPCGNPRSLCEDLDGLVTRRLGSFDAETEVAEVRVLLVTFHVTECPAVALLACRKGGLLKAKLDKMNDADASYVYLTTLCEREPEN